MRIYEYIHEEYLKKIGWPIRGNFYRNFFEQVAEGYKNLLSFNHSLIKGTFQNFIFKFPNFLREENLSTVQTFQKKIHPRYLSRKSLLLSTKCQLFPFSSLPPFEIFYILSTINRISHAVSQQISPHSRDDNPFAESRKREGGQQAERGGEGEGKSCGAARRSNGGGCREALREGKGWFNESATSKCHATPLFVT